MDELSFDDSWKDISNWVSLRYSPKTPRFHGCGLTKTFDMFDWVIWTDLDESINRMDVTNPKKILCLSSEKCVKTLLDNSHFSSQPSLVVAGMDMLLSSVINDIDEMSSKFSKIYFEAKDIESDCVQSFSMGFISYYLRDAVPSNIKRAIDISDSTDKSKQVLAAWGQRWKYLDGIIDDRGLADKFLSSQDFLSRESIPFDDYWQRLAEYHFLLAPKGQGVQSPKLAEAWMVKTIPIVTKNPCFVDLARMGYPLILIDDWKEVTPENVEKWQSYYEQIDWLKVRYMITNEYLNSLL